MKGGDQTPLSSNQGGDGILERIDNNHKNLNFPCGSSVKIDTQHAWLSIQHLLYDYSNLKALFKLQRLGEEIHYFHL